MVKYWYCLGLIWLISNFELENALNYLYYHGLIREKDQLIDYRHSWDNSTMFSSWFFIEIGRKQTIMTEEKLTFELDEVGTP